MAYASEFRYKRSGHKKNKLSSRRKAFIIGAAVFAVIIIVTVCLQRNVSGILYELSEASVRAMAVRSVNEAVSETLSGAGYDSFVTIGYDESGNVREITANSQKVNLFARTTATAAMAKLGAASAEGIKVPLGAFTGISFLAGFGPKVTFIIISVSSVIRCGRQSDAAFRLFERLGGGQRRHAVGGARDRNADGRAGRGNGHRGGGARRVFRRGYIRRRLSSCALNGKISMSLPPFAVSENNLRAPARFSLTFLRFCVKIIKKQRL